MASLGFSFNSRPHTEVDHINEISKRAAHLSIHDLTRRSTRTSYIFCEILCLSIHDLTRRSTHVMSHILQDLWAFNSRPHTEVDSGSMPENTNKPLSIHDLTRRSTGRRTRISRVPCLSIHDLTRRSTTGGAEFELDTYPFNSRPHKEVDKWNTVKDFWGISFNSRPHKEVDSIHPTEGDSGSTFNSRPHKEVDNVFESVHPKSSVLSIHDLTRRSTG